jgi:hypothetical protein
MHIVLYVLQFDRFPDVTLLASVHVYTTGNIILAEYAEKRLIRRGAHVSSAARQPSTDRDMLGRNQTVTRT